VTRPLNPQTAQAMLVAGVMSGTSADGVDVALIRIAPASAPDATPSIELVGHRGFPYAPEVRERVLSAMDARTISVAELARLNWRLGEVYADCVAQTCAELNIATPAAPLPQRPCLDLIGLHGQTLYHQAVAEEYAGSNVRATSQTGEPAVLHERLGVPVVSDFRPADLSAGGQGAPLVPMLDFCLFRSQTHGRVLLNLGGIANVTVLPAGAGKQQTAAFDTGPANMILDALMQSLYGRAYDANGEIAASGNPVRQVVEVLLQNPFFSAKPPKSCGREQFGSAFAERLQSLCEAAGTSKADVIATAAELTVQSVVRAVDNFCEPLLQREHAPTELIISGGGAHNLFLMERLRQECAQRGITVFPAGDLGIPVEAKEAVAFALLAWLSWHRLPGNIPSATGASHAVVLGRITC
jgi:anhydro-N-acetylmuramic acid kinase